MTVLDVEYCSYVLSFDLSFLKMVDAVHGDRKLHVSESCQYMLLPCSLLEAPLLFRGYRFKRVTSDVPHEGTQKVLLCRWGGGRGGGMLTTKLCIIYICIFHFKNRANYIYQVKRSKISIFSHLLFTFHLLPKKQQLLPPSKSRCLLTTRYELPFQHYLDEIYASKSSHCTDVGLLLWVSGFDSRSMRDKYAV